MPKLTAFVCALWLTLSTTASAQDYQAKAITTFTGECRFQIPRYDLPRYDSRHVDQSGLPVDQWVQQGEQQQACDTSVFLGELFNGRFFVSFSNDDYLISLWGSEERKPNEDFYLSINTVNVVRTLRGWADPNVTITKAYRDRQAKYRPGHWSDDAKGMCHFLLDKSTSRFITCKIDNRFGLTWNLHLDDIKSFDGKTFPPIGSSAAKTFIVPLQQNGSGTYVVPVLINNAISLKFVLDSGATDVSIPADVVMTLMRTDTLKNADFLGTQTYKLADGSTVPSTTFRIKSLTVGSELVENVLGSVAPVNGPLILGQSFLGRFRSWTIDNVMHALVLGQRRPEPDSSKGVDAVGVDVQGDKVLLINKMGTYFFVCPLSGSASCEPIQ